MTDAARRSNISNCSTI